MDKVVHFLPARVEHGMLRARRNTSPRSRTPGLRALLALLLVVAPTFGVASPHADDAQRTAAVAPGGMPAALQGASRADAPAPWVPVLPPALDVLHGRSGLVPRSAARVMGERPAHARRVERRLHFSGEPDDASPVRHRA